MNIQEFHEWIGDNNRFNVTLYNRSRCFGPGGSSADIGPFLGKNLDFSFLIFYAGRNYIFEEDRYEYKYIESISKYSEGYSIVCTKKYPYFSLDTRETNDITQEIFIKKL